MRDRLPTPGKENRVKITMDDGTTIEGVLSCADDAAQGGSVYSKENVLPDDVCAMLDIDSETSEPKDAFRALYERPGMLPAYTIERCDPIPTLTSNVRYIGRMGDFETFYGRDASYVHHFITVDMRTGETTSYAMCTGSSSCTWVPAWDLDAGVIAIQASVRKIVVYRLRADGAGFDRDEVDHDAYTYSGSGNARTAFLLRNYYIFDTYSEGNYRTIYAVDLLAGTVTEIVSIYTNYNNYAYGLSADGNIIVRQGMADYHSFSTHLYQLDGTQLAASGSSTVKTNSVLTGYGNKVLQAGGGLYDITTDSVTQLPLAVEMSGDAYILSSSEDGRVLLRTGTRIFDFDLAAGTVLASYDAAAAVTALQYAADFRIPITGVSTGAVVGGGMGGRCLAVQLRMTAYNSADYRYAVMLIDAQNFGFELLPCSGTIGVGEKYAACLQNGTMAIYRRCLLMMEGGGQN